MSEPTVSPIEAFSAIKQMQETKGWKLFLERFSSKGDAYLSQLLDTNCSDNGLKYTKRDLVAHQLEALGTVNDVLKEFEIEAKAEKSLG